MSTNSYTKSRFSANDAALLLIDHQSGIMQLHRFRKTYADTLHEEGVSVNTIRIRLGPESLDVTLAYLKGKDAGSEEALELM